MQADWSDNAERWAAAVRALKIFVLPPVLTLVVILFALAALVDHQTRESRENTCVEDAGR